jgi:hypothetical protein
MEGGLMRGITMVMTEGDTKVEIGKANDGNRVELRLSTKEPLVLTDDGTELTITMSRSDAAGIAKFISELL